MKRKNISLVVTLYMRWLIYQAMSYIRGSLYTRRWPIYEIAYTPGDDLYIITLLTSDPVPLCVVFTYICILMKKYS